MIANIITQIPMEYIKYDISDFYNVYTTQKNNIFLKPKTQDEFTSI